MRQAQSGEPFGSISGASLLAVAAVGGQIRPAAEVLGAAVAHRLFEHQAELTSAQCTRHNHLGPYLQQHPASSRHFEPLAPPGAAQSAHSRRRSGADAVPFKVAAQGHRRLDRHRICRNALCGTSYEHLPQQERPPHTATTGPTASLLQQLESSWRNQPRTQRPPLPPAH